MPFEHTAKANAEGQLHTKVKEPIKTVDIIPGLKHNSLLSISKFAEANYLSVFTLDEEQIFDGKKATITSSMESILYEWKDK